MPTVLFVCTANICRSPMAEGLFRSMLQARGLLPEWRVESAGTWGMETQPAAPEAVRLLGERGIDIQDHRSRIVDRGLIDQADLILAMERGHKEALRFEFSDKAERIFLLSEMAGQEYDIADPISQPPEAFRRTVEELTALLEQGFERIIELGVRPQDSAP